MAGVRSVTVDMAGVRSVTADMAGVRSVTVDMAGVRSVMVHMAGVTRGFADVAQRVTQEMVNKAGDVMMSGLVDVAGRTVPVVDAAAMSVVRVPDL